MEGIDRNTKIRILFKISNNKNFTYIGNFISEDDTFITILDRKMGILKIRKDDILVISTKDKDGKELI